MSQGVKIELTMAQNKGKSETFIEKVVGAYKAKSKHRVKFQDQKPRLL